MIAQAQGAVLPVVHAVSGTLAVGVTATQLAGETSRSAAYEVLLCGQMPIQLFNGA